MSDGPYKVLQEMSTHQPSWLDASGRDEEEVVISTAATLARNLQGYTFPANADEPELNEVSGQVWSVSAGIEQLTDAVSISLDELPREDRLLLSERQLINREMIDSTRPSGIAVNRDEQFSLVINDIDHIRFQQASAGLCPEQCWEALGIADDIFGKELTFAFREPFGYLTASPTNVGTGLCINILVHLPALALTNQTEAVLRHVTGNGVQVRGAYSEGSAVYGNLYLVSNRLTFGRSKSDISDSVTKPVALISDHELQARSTLWHESRTEVEDRIHRSLGLLQNARVLAFRECMHLLSIVRLGVNMKVLPGVTISKLDSLMILTQPSHLDHREGRVLDSSERDIVRAELARNTFEVTGGTG